MITYTVQARLVSGITSIKQLQSYLCPMQELLYPRHSEEYRELQKGLKYAKPIV